MDRLITRLAKIAVYLQILPKGDIRHMYLWKATDVACAQVNGQPTLTRRMVDEWCFWELRYAVAGYEPLSLEELKVGVVSRICMHDLRGQPSPWHVPRASGQPVVLHASLFRQNFLEGASP